MITLFCTKHPQYQAAQPPKDDCESCRTMWNAVSKPDGLCIARHATEKALVAGFKKRGK